MATPETSFKQVGKINNIRPQIPLVTTIFIALLIVIIVWFLRGGSFRLYASLFFGIYHFTHLAWLSIMLVAVVQNIFFLPLRFLYERFYVDLKKFESELKKTKDEEQYFLLNRNVREGNASVIFYIINFVFLFIAFFSAGRVFLLEFYRTPISRVFLYKFIPYPQYPLQGVIFKFPFWNITQTYAVPWSTIFHLWLWPILFFVALRLLWRFLKPVLSKNAGLLRLRIGFNRVYVIIGGFIGTFLIITTVILRHLPTQFYFHYLIADLSYQNTTFNFITAICTFFAAIYSGIQHNQEETHEARKAGIPEDVIAKVRNAYTRVSIRNGLVLGFFAFWITRLMPCSHDLSVLSFEACYVLSPITFDLVIPRSNHRK
jgi:hypothetical protein